MSNQPSRRSFLQAALGAVASLFLPRFLAATGKPRSFWFLRTRSGESWPVADPVHWSLENARQPLLQRAKDGLLKLTPADGDRIIRHVTRRCKLNLLELRPGRAVVHHWGQQGLAELRPFFKARGLARRNVEVVVRDRKKEVITTQTGDDFLFGDRVAATWPLELFLGKWQRRFEEQSDDWSAAPGTWSGYAWDGIEDNRIPWAGLKSAWRRTAPVLCSNCDRPTLLANFGYPWVGMFNRSPSFIHVCGACRRSFVDSSVQDVGNWIMANLDAEVLPDFLMMWDRRVRLEATIT
jgi:hypothetical protein